MLILLLLYVLFSVFFYLGFEKIRKQSEKFSRKNIVGTPKVSVLVSFHNEELFVEKLLKNLLNQTYPHYELILIDDRSTDNTLNILQQYAVRFPEKIKIIKIKELPDKITYGKKYALQEGAKHAQGKYFLFTDADCEVPNTWIEEYLKVFTNSEHDFVLGISYYKDSPGLLGALIVFDNLLTTYLYLSLSAWGFTYMAVGRNMGMKPELFFRLKFYKELGTGIDDLSVQQAKSPYPLCSPGSFTYSAPLKTFSAYFRQQRRHLKSFSLYKKHFKGLLLLLFLLEILFFIALFVEPLLITGYFFRGFLFYKNVKKIKKSLNLGKVYIMFAVWLGVRLYLSLTYKQKKEVWTKSDEKHFKYFL